MHKFVKVPVVIVVLTLYALVGLVVALNKDYGVIDNGSDFWTLALAIALWPLVLLGADVTIQF